jgi:lipopolysaccharide/colanic/teichoic acid biosynthesis glycosyltransferase
VYYYPSDEQTPYEQESAIDRKESSSASQAESLEPLFAQPINGWKRCLDILGAITAGILLSPVLIMAALAVRLSSPGPVIFGQMRSGRGGVPFLIYKFRSMVADAEEMKKDLLAHSEQDGPAFKIRSDPRVTWVGKILRATSIDELPQLWNVLKGEMSLVGPRPLPCEEAANCRSWQRRRIDVTPGITCVWQLSGRSHVSFDDWVRMDINYIRQSSFVGDIKLIVGTLPVLIWRPSGC